MTSFLHCVEGSGVIKMPYKFKKDCPTCSKPEFLSLSDQLRQVHRLKSLERMQWLKAAVFRDQREDWV